MNRRQKKKKSKENDRKLKKFFKKHGIKLRDNEATSSRYKIEPIIVFQSLEQLEQTLRESGDGVLG